jgi:hypothetical protein
MRPPLFVSAGPASSKPHGSFGEAAERRPGLPAALEIYRGRYDLESDVIYMQAVRDRAERDGLDWKPVKPAIGLHTFNREPL